MIRRPPRSTLSSSSAASDVYKRQPQTNDETKKKISRQLAIRLPGCNSYSAAIARVFLPFHQHTYILNRVSPPSTLPATTFPPSIIMADIEKTPKAPQISTFDIQDPVVSPSSSSLDDTPSSQAQRVRQNSVIQDRGFLGRLRHYEAVLDKKLGLSLIHI